MVDRFSKANSNFCTIILGITSFPRGHIWCNTEDKRSDGPGQTRGQEKSLKYLQLSKQEKNIINIGVGEGI